MARSVTAAVLEPMIGFFGCIDFGLLIIRVYKLDGDIGTIALMVTCLVAFLVAVAIHHWHTDRSFRPDSDDDTDIY